jgi:hypothetical protein
MSKPNTTSAVANVRQGPPVRVKVFGADGKIAKVHPPDGEHKGWWLRLNKALGTRSHDFVNASLFQIQSASRSPWGGISELYLNAALAMIEPQRRRMKLRERSPSRWPVHTQPLWRSLLS